MNGFVVAVFVALGTSCLMFGQKIEPDIPDPLGDVQMYSWASGSPQSGEPACDVVFWGAGRGPLETEFVFECAAGGDPLKARGTLFLRREGEGGFTFGGNGNELRGVNAQISFWDGSAYISPKLFLTADEPFLGTTVPVLVEGQTIRIRVSNQALLLTPGVDLEVASYINDALGFDMAPDIGFGPVKPSPTYTVIPPRSRQLLPGLAGAGLVVAVVPQGWTIKGIGELPER